MKAFLVLSAALLLAFSASAQDTASTPRTWYLTFGVEMSVANISAHSMQHLELARYVSDTDPPVLDWVDTTSEQADLLATHYFNTYGFHIGFSPFRNFMIALRYKGLVMKDTAINTTGFFSIAGQIKYTYYMPFHQNVYATIAASAGGFQGLSEGVGSETYLAIQPGIGYSLFDRISLEAFYSHDWFLYRNEHYADYVDREEVEVENWHFGSIGLGLAYHFHLKRD